ncbi:hypothetical protein [Streptosporangium sp. NPDC023615]
MAAIAASHRGEHRSRDRKQFHILTGVRPRSIYPRGFDALTQSSHLAW